MTAIPDRAASSTAGPLPQSRPGTIVWIASYPKSGNTWVRFLVCNLVFGLQDSAAALNAMAPDLHELPADFEPPATACLIKTHFPLSRRLPFLERSAAAIYVLRHPADVLLSSFHYSRRSGTAAAGPAAQLDVYAENFLQARGDPRWQQLGIGPWDDHVRSWLDPGAPFPVLMLRYEDLLQRPLEGARHISDFLGLGQTPEQLAAAVAGASFKRMREIEEADIRHRRVGIFYKPYLQRPIDSGLRFMRSGRSGEGAVALEQHLHQRLTQLFAPLMTRYGYGNEIGGSR